MKYLTVEEVSAVTRETPENTRRRCASGQIKAKRLGGSWRVSEDDLTIFMEAPRTGSPRKKRLTKRQRQQLGQVS